MDRMQVMLVLLVVSFAATSHADSISCDRGIVSSGDRAADLLVKCGEPEWRDSRTEEVVERFGVETKRTITVVVDPGPRSTIAHLVGIPHLVVAVNKMDLVGWRQDVFSAIVAEFNGFAGRTGFAGAGTTSGPAASSLVMVGGAIPSALASTISMRRLRLRPSGVSFPAIGCHSP